MGLTAFPASVLFTGTLADARVAESNVTQHEAALTITESQISDLGSYLPLSGGTLTGDLAMGSNSITGLAAPVNSGDAATKDYVDGIASGVVWKKPVLSVTLTTPPGSPSTGDRYLVADSATGDWSGQEDKIAEWNGAAWVFTAPDDGWVLFCSDDEEERYYRYDGDTAEWVGFGTALDHNSLINLTTGDPHTQYHTDSRATTWLGTKSLADLGTRSAGDLTSGTLDDARVAQSNVTQHQAALTITKSQVSDFGSYLPLSGGTMTGNIVTSGLVDGRDLSADGSKLDGIETGATADMTASEILTAIKTVDGTGSGLDADLLDGSEAAAFPLLAGRSGGQTLIGGTASANNLTLQSTSHATKGLINFGSTSNFDEAANRLTLATSSSSPSDIFRMQCHSASNDTAHRVLGVTVGADGTLGALALYWYAKPSATAANRWASLAVGDSSALRPLLLNTINGTLWGQVGIGTTTLAVGGFDAQLTVQAASSSNIPLLVRGASSQAAAYLRVQTNGGTNLLNILAGTGNVFEFRNSSGTPVFTIAHDLTTRIYDDLILSGIPTSNPGIAGYVWNDGGTLKISAG